ncbi:Uncharacterised protein [Mycobacteroides abscessus subsp. abscessus]|nr:Uncharacterised protein [Mycobacteroides abscessus subsp. abscessus]
MAREHVLGLSDGLTEQSPPPQGEAVTLLRVLLDRIAHLGDDELRMTRGAQHRLEHGGRLSGQRVDNLAIEVGRQGVPDIRLDHRLQPRARQGQRMVILQRLDVRLHGRQYVNTLGLHRIPEHLVMAHL